MDSSCELLGVWCLKEWFSSWTVWPLSGIMEEVEISSTLVRGVKNNILLKYVDFGVGRETAMDGADRWTGHQTCRYLID